MRYSKRLFSVKDLSGRTPLFLAIVGGNQELIQYMKDNLLDYNNPQDMGIISLNPVPAQKDDKDDSDSDSLPESSHESFWPKTDRCHDSRCDRSLSTQPRPFVQLYPRPHLKEGLRVGLNALWRLYPSQLHGSDQQDPTYAGTGGDGAYWFCGRV
ncbi:hypothetical protein LB503_006244 [Fusarium chuoi]|nr:hypothetical protein LB503_006244 [Fusarium chuoi]